MPKPLSKIVSALEQLAPLALAESWDNVGLLIHPAKRKSVSKILLTIDLTEAVLDEAISKKSQMVVAYHPPIFKPIKSLGAGALPTRCIEAGIAVYSPHTALDAVAGGVNDWLCDAFGLEGATRYAIQPAADETPMCKLVVFVPRTHVDALREELAIAGAGRIGHYYECSFELDGTGTFVGDASTNPTVGQRGRLEKVDEVRLEMICPEVPWLLQDIEATLRHAHPYEQPAWDLYPLQQRPKQDCGQGRDLCLDQPITLAQTIERVKKHLGLSHLRVAAAEGHGRGAVIQHIMLCAGAGGSVLGNHAPDLFLTGEMRHHDVLAANARGTSVILTEHTHCERPYLPTFKKKLKALLGAGVQIDLSRKDRDPLKMV